ncbi:MAG: MFS transporter, partial [Thermoguttaceae bacterium]|nr:MFS transporter [Thermoguttaceae bacterium]
MPDEHDGIGSSPPQTRRAEVWAWALYDWANSAYSTILITVVMLYISQVVFPPRYEGDAWGETVYAWCISASMVVAAILSPVVGAMADVNRSKRRWLAATALGGAGCAILLAAISPAWPVVVVAAFLLVSLCFELSLGVYNAFLPEITDESTVNRVSAMGFGLGYVGGAIALVLALGVLFLGDRIGIDTKPGQLRAGIVIMGLWWGGFSVPTLVVLRDRGPVPTHPRPLAAAVGKAASHANQTTLYLTPLHGRADVLKRLIANIGAALRHVRAAAEQFKD